MRTPLAGALGMIKLVLEMEIGDEERKLLEMAKRSADSLLRIIADVLDFSRLEAGMMSFEEKFFSTTDVVRAPSFVEGRGFRSGTGEGR
jgi:signal transduction histidine kinase